MSARPFVSRIALAAVALLAVSACSSPTPSATTAAPQDTAPVSSPAADSSAAETPAESPTESTPATSEAATPAESSAAEETPAATGEAAGVLFTGEVAGITLKPAPDAANIPTPPPGAVQPAGCLTLPPSGTAMAVGFDATMAGSLALAVASGEEYYSAIEKYIADCPTATVEAGGVKAGVTNTTLPAPAVEGADKVAAFKQVTQGMVADTETATTILQVVGTVGGYTVVASAMTMDGSEPDIANAVAAFNAQAAKIKG